MFRASSCLERFSHGLDGDFCKSQIDRHAKRSTSYLGQEGLSDFLNNIRVAAYVAGFDVKRMNRILRRARD
jgi:hypothetical protein